MGGVFLPTTIRDFTFINNYEVEGRSVWIGDSIFKMDSNYWLSYMLHLSKNIDDNEKDLRPQMTSLLSLADMR